MFYHPLILSHRNKMQLIKPWLAATRGIGKMKSTEIIECDTIKICKGIMEFLTSESRDPTKRLSLRLSTMLIHGMVLIWRQQVIFLIEEMDNCIKIYEKAIMHLTEILAESTGMPILEKKKARKRKRVTIVETPESLVLLRNRNQMEQGDVLVPELFKEQDTAIVHARVEDITLREDQPLLRQENEDNFGEPWPAVMPEISEPHDIIVQADVHVPAEPPEELERAIPTIQVDKPVEAPEIINILPGVEYEEDKSLQKGADEIQEITKKMDVEQEIEEIPPKTTTIAEEQLVEKEEEAERDVVIIPKVIKKKGILEKPRKEKFRPITKKLETFIDEEDYTAIREQKIPPFVPMKKFWPDWSEDHAMVDVARTEIGTRTLTSTGTVELARGTPSLGSLVQSTPQEVATSRRRKPVSTPTKRGLSGDETLTEVMPPAANGRHFSPTQKRKVLLVEEADLRPFAKPVQEIETLPPPIEEQTAVEPSVQAPELEMAPEQPIQEEIYIPTEDDYLGIKWSRRIMQVVYTNIRIAPDDICKQLQERLTKLNMARIFSSLLDLQGRGYVTLHAAENSSKLEAVERGATEFF